MKKTIKKLTLKIETVKQLDDARLSAVLGGITGDLCQTYTVACPSDTGACGHASVCLCSIGTTCRPYC